MHVPAARLRKWIAGFDERHGAAHADIVDGILRLTGADASSAVIRPPYPVEATDPELFAEACLRVPRTAVILVRRGGFAAAIVEGKTVIASDIGKRHVQGRTAAGGWSQQRFARRRDKQVHELVQAAADYAARVIVPELPVEYVATGGDRPLIDEVLADPRLRSLVGMPRGPHLDVPDPRRDVVASLPERLGTLRIDVTDGA